MKSSLKYFISSALLWATFNSYAQVISGTIVDQAGEPLPGCNVYLEGTFFGTSTNSSGVFKFEAEQMDSAIFKVEFIGYEDYAQKITLLADFTIEIVLQEEFSKLNAVTVSAGAYGTGDGDKTAVLSSLDVVTTAGALGDVTGAMQSLPGTATNGESGRLFVHGGSANETGTYIDGILVHQPYTTSAPNMAVRGRFNPFMFSGTAFSTGGYSAEFGQALSSVLVLNTNEMPDEDELNIGIMTVGADVAGTKMWKNGAVTVGANYMNLSPYMSLIPQNYDWNKAPESFGGSMSFRQKTKYNGMFKVYASMDESDMNQQQFLLGFPVQSQAVNVNNKNRFMNTNWKGMLSKKWMVKIGASFTHNKDSYEVGSLLLDDLLKGAHAKALAMHQVNEKVHVTGGIEYFYKSFTKAYSYVESTSDSAVNFEDHKPVAFMEAEVFTNNKFGFKAGLRSEYSSYLDRFNVSPRLSAAYKVSDKGQLSASYGWFYQDPINEQIILRPYLNYERADHYVLSYAHNYESRNFRVEAYYKDYQQLVKYPDQMSTYTNNGHGYAYGLDLFYRDRKSIKNGDYWISYSFLNAQRDYLNYPESAMPSFASAHNVSVVYKHWFSDLRSQLGATFTYGSPRPHNNPNHENFMDDQLKPYVSLDLNWSFLHRENVIFHAAISNVLGIKNSFGYNYSPVPDVNGTFSRTEILPPAKRFFFIGCFITLSERGDKNQLEKIN